MAGEDLKEGQVFGPYTILKRMGDGGMSYVYRARDGENDREVILKFPSRDLLADPVYFERFQRETRIGGLLEHPNIQRFYARSGEDWNPYLVLEYVPGCTLRDEIHRHRTDGEDLCRREARTTTLGLQIGGALAYAHSRGVVHRDLKPENVIVTPDGEAKLMDFGIAYVQGARRITWGPLSGQAGTPDYMPPEQIKGKRGDERTDIYALGMMLYEVIAGRMPYESGDPLQVMNKHVTTSPTPLRHFCHDVSPVVQEIIMKAIRRKPEARWPKMQDFVDALARPDAVDVVGLKAERERNENDLVGGPAINNDFGMPMWQVAAISFATVFILVGSVFVFALLGAHH